MNGGSRLPAEIFLSSVPAGPLETRVAVSLMVLLGIGFLGAAPFARLPLGAIPAFVPAYEAALIICDLLTAVLLVGQFVRIRSIALLVLSGGYLFDALMIIAHALSFPGLFAAHGLLGAGEQTTLWLYVFWHGGFPVFVLGYAALRRREEAGASAVSTGIALPCMVGLTTLVATGFGILAFPGQYLLPNAITGLDHTRLLTTGISPGVWLLGIVAFVVQWRGRRRSILDLWLATVMWAWIMDVGLAIVIGGTRFDWGFYLSRSYGLFAATVVLGALLLEMNRLYASLADALELAETRNLQLIRSREDLGRAQRLEAVGQLTGGVAHDFNNLLTVISGALELMLGRGDLPPPVRRLAERALQGANRGARTVDQLLTFARRQVGQQVVAEVKSMLEEFAPLLRQAVGAEIELVLRLAPEATPVRIDAAQFEAAILNLAVNARDAMPSGGRVTIYTRTLRLAEQKVAELPAGRYVLVSVVDTGEGMPKAVADRVFEPFFTTKPVGKGSGLGLSQVYGFVTGSGGHVRIDSRPGQGTSVSLYFPLCDAPPETSPTPAPAAPGRSAGARILVVEDDADVLELSSLRLAQLGYDVRQAHDADEARRILRGEPIDLLFTDIVLPKGGSGVQLAAEVRRAFPSVAVLLTSGTSKDVLEQPDGNPLPGALLRKPYSQDELASRVREALET